jgi:2-octaprenyl-6-methoxyphenol hydroxylase
MSHKIVILGSGLSGLITALSLASLGIRSTILEYKDFSSDSFFWDVRTTALNNSSMKFFHDIGIGDKIDEISGFIRDIYVVENRSDDMLHFKSIPEYSDISITGLKSWIPSPFAGNQGVTFDTANFEVSKVGNLVENSSLKNILLDLASKSDFIQLIDNVDYRILENNHEYCSLEIIDNKSGKVLQEDKFDLAIVCDGYKSKAKSQYFGNKVHKEYEQSAIVFNVSHENDHEGTAVEHFIPSGPFAILPLRDRKSSSIVWTLPLKTSETMLKLDDSLFLSHVKENFGEFLGEIKILTKPVSFPLRAYITDKYFNNRIALVADTAHIIHPLAGQGLNQGIKDIKALCGLLQKSSINKALKIYQDMRYHDNFMMYFVTDKINSIFSNNSKISSKLRKIGLKLLDKMPFVKTLMIDYAGGI